MLPRQIEFARKGLSVSLAALLQIFQDDAAAHIAQPDTIDKPPEQGGQDQNCA